MTRILHVSQVAKAGVGTYLDLIWSVRDAGHHHSAVLPQSQPGGVASAMPRVSFDDRGRGLGCIWRMLRAVRKEIRRLDPDIVFLHSSYAMTLIPALRFGRAKVVFCAHGWPSDRYAGGWKRALAVGAERVLPKWADRVVNISAYEQGVAVARGLGRTAVMIENAALPVAAEAPPQMADQGKLRLVFVGRFAPQKGLDLLLGAFARCQRRDLELEIIGGTPKEVGGSLPEGARVLDWMSKPQLAGRIAAADALIVPSRWEGFGLVIAEAFAQGTPALVSRVGAMPDLITPGETGDIFEADEDAVLACLNRVDKAALRAMRPACRKAYQSRFHPDRFSAEINGLFEGLAG